MTQVTLPRRLQQVLVLNAPTQLSTNDLQVAVNIVKAFDNLQEVLDLVRRDPHELLRHLTLDFARRMIRKYGISPESNIEIKFEPSHQGAIAEATEEHEPHYSGGGLSISRLTYGSPIEISIGGWIPELVESLRQVIKDLQWRNAHERRLATTEEAQKDLEFQQKSLELQKGLLRTRTCSCQCFGTLQS